MRDGDRNTAFFHKKVEQRRKRNTIRGVTDDGGTWRVEEEEMEVVFLNYFKELFTSNADIDMQVVLYKVQGKVNEKMNVMLEAEYTEDEVKNVLKHMHPTKAPGPDGMPTLFYKKFWHIVKDEVVRFALDTLNKGRPVD